jgi:cell division protein FtsW
MAQLFQIQNPKSKIRNQKSETGMLPRADYPLLAAVGALIVIGLLMIYSASYDLAFQSKDNAAFYVVRQALFVVVGCLVAFVLARSDFTTWRRWSVLLLGGILLLLVLVRLFGADKYGAQRSFFDGSVQPSEIAKLIVIIYIADWLASKGEKIRDVNYGLIPFAAIVGLVAGLIVIQPDFGTAILIVLTAGIMFFMAGADLKQIFFSLFIAGLVAALLMAVTQHTQNRWQEYLDSLKDLSKASDQLKQAIMALQVGGLTGVGLGNGLATIGYLPLAHTDTIFALIASETGLVGVVALLSLYGVVAYRGYHIAMSASNSYGQLLAIGATSYIILQALINVNVMTGTLPLTGIPLPFVSYGGSSLVSVMAAIGILISVSRGSRKGKTHGAFMDRSRRDRRSRLSSFGSR